MNVSSQISAASLDEIKTISDNPSLTPAPSLVSEEVGSGSTLLNIGDKKETDDSNLHESEKKTKSGSLKNTLTHVCSKTELSEPLDSGIESQGSISSYFGQTQSMDSNSQQLLRNSSDKPDEKLLEETELKS